MNVKLNQKYVDDFRVIEIQAQTVKKNQRNQKMVSWKINRRDNTLGIIIKIEKDYILPVAPMKKITIHSTDIKKIRSYYRKV